MSNVRRVNLGLPKPPGLLDKLYKSEISLI